MPKKSPFSFNENGRCFHHPVSCTFAPQPKRLAVQVNPLPASLHCSGPCGIRPRARYLRGGGSSARSGSSCPSPEEGGDPRPTSEKPVNRLLQGRGSGGSAVSQDQPPPSPFPPNPRRFLRTPVAGAASPGWGKSGRGSRSTQQRKGSWHWGRDAKSGWGEPCK